MWPFIMPDQLGQIVKISIFVQGTHVIAHYILFFLLSVVGDVIVPHSVASIVLNNLSNINTPLTSPQFWSVV